MTTPYGPRIVWEFLDYYLSVLDKDSSFHYCSSSTVDREEEIQGGKQNSEVRLNTGTKSILREIGSTVVNHLQKSRVLLHRTSNR